MDNISRLSHRARERATVAGFLAGAALTSAAWFGLLTLVGVGA